MSDEDTKKAAPTPDEIKKLIEKEVASRTRELNGLYSVIKDIIDSIPAGILVVNSKNDVMLANLKLYEIFEPDADSLLFLKIKDSLGAEISGIVEDAISSGAVYKEKEISILAKQSGKRKILRASNFPLRGGERRQLFVFEDVTERRRLERDLKLRERLSALGQLVAGVAHEVNNPLNAIVGLLELMQRRGDIPADAREDVRMMKDYAMRIALIVQDLNRYTRASRIVEKSRRDANVIIAETLKLVRQSNPRAENVEIIVETVDDCPVRMMNPLEISQVLTNLLNNAIDSLYERRLNEPEAKAQIKVKTAVRADRVEISVEDNGLGIPKDALPQIFNPFFSTKRYGSGLGLALSEKIVNDHDGEIIVDTEEGKYTVFTVSLPALK